MIDPHHDACGDNCQAKQIEALMSDAHVRARLAGEPHHHHEGCIHNLTPDEQIALRGKTREWWIAMGLPEPVQITSADWEPVDAD